MLKRVLSLICIAVMMIGMLSMTAAADAPVAVIGGTNYTTLQDAVDAIEEDATGLIELKKSTDETVTVTCDVYVDLAGNSIAGVDVKAGTFYGMDSATIITAEEPTAGSYGKIASVKGSVKPISVDDEYSADSYLMAEDNGTSFHAVNLRLTDMSLRAEKAGVYFKSDFAGDSVVASKVKRFGVALSIKGVPTAANIKTTDCARSSFSGFTAGVNNNATSTLLSGIMKDDNPFVLNKRNSEMPVYGRAYVELKDGSFIFGAAESRTLKQQTELAAKDTAKVNDHLIGMYKKFAQVMSAWNVANIESSLIIDRENPVSKDKSSLKILAITSSFGRNTTELLYDVAKAEGYEEVIVARLYGSGCPLSKHVENAKNNTAFYEYTKNSNGQWDTQYEYDVTGQTGATMQYGLADEQWDVIFVQQSASQAGYLPSYEDYIDQLMPLIKGMINNDPKFIWNMTWAFQYGNDNAAFSRYFNNDQMYMYESIVSVLQKMIVPRNDFDAIIPSGTAVQNARTSYFGDNLCIDKATDRIHLNTLGRVIAAYTLYATLTGQELESISLVNVPAASTPQTGALALSEDDKLVIKESVNNALADPFHVTQSVYTENN